VKAWFLIFKCGFPSKASIGSQELQLSQKFVILFAIKINMTKIIKINIYERFYSKNSA